MPTPINTDHTPDLFPVENASRIVGRNLTPGSIVIYESIVYPGVTEDVCVPILEKESGLKCGVNFKVGYSPECINPGDKVHTLTTIRKIVSGMDEESCRIIKQVYDIVIAAGTHPVSNIRTAEAVKVVENSQRDIIIAFMNELAMVFDKMGIDTNEVIEGMNTKWNALGFRPGLVGGHCIGVDPYYFTYEAEKLGYHSQIILNGRIVNDSIFTMAYSTFNLAWQESASITVTDTDYNKYYNEVFSALFDFLTGCMLLLIAASPVLFKILIRGDYDLAYDQMPLLYIGVFLSCISSYFGSIYIAKKATKEVGISSAIGAAINAVVNLSMVHWAGLYAASVSTIVSYLALVIYRTRDVEKKNFVHIEYNKAHILICLSLIVLCSVLCYLRVGILNWINLGIGIIGFFALNHKLLKQVLNGVMKKLKGNRT